MTILHEKIQTGSFETALQADLQNLVPLTLEFIKDQYTSTIFDSNLLDDKGKAAVLNHVADSVIRSKRGYGYEKNLDLDDIVYIATAIELRKRDKRDRKKPLLEYIPLEKEVQIAIAKRCVEYLQQFTPKKYQTDDVEMQRLALESCFATEFTREELKKAHGITADYIIRRMEAFKNEEQLYLAIFFGGTSVALTLSEGQGAYNYNGGDYALWINRRPRE